jgi:hypothetical protein
MFSSRARLECAWSSNRSPCAARGSASYALPSYREPGGFCHKILSITPGCVKRSRKLFRPGSVEEKRRFGPACAAGRHGGDADEAFPSRRRAGWLQLSCTVDVSCAMCIGMLHRRCSFSSWLRRGSKARAATPQVQAAQSHGAWRGLQVCDATLLRISLDRMRGRKECNEIQPAPAMSLASSAAESASSWSTMHE